MVSWFGAADAYGKTQCSKETLCIKVVEAGNEVQFYAINKKEFHITVELELKIKEMQYKEAKKPLYVVNPLSENYLFSLQKKNSKKWHYRYKYWWNKGSYLARHAADTIYHLPYDSGSSYKVSQSCNGKSTHYKDYNRYAIDFSMPEGTPVLAARGGKVVDLYEYSIIGGRSKLDYRFGNFILIEHDDKTIAAYYHLKTMGALVDIGQQVKTGEFIGYSGNTGYSSGPHLHFVVNKTETARKKRSVKTRFASVRGVVQCPKKGSRPVSVDI